MSKMSGRKLVAWLMDPSDAVVDWSTEAIWIPYTRVMSDQLATAAEFGRKNRSPFDIWTNVAGSVRNTSGSEAVWTCILTPKAEFIVAPVTDPASVV